MISAACFLNAAESGKPANPRASSDAKARLEALVAEFENAQQDFNKQMREAKSPEERDKLMDDMPPLKFAPRFLKFVRENARDTIAIDAVIQLAPAKPFSSELDEALLIIVEHHAANDSVVRLFEALTQGSSLGTERFYDELVQKSSNRNVQGRACLAAAQFLSTLEDALLSLPPADSPMNAQIEKYVGKEMLKQLRETDREQLGEKAEAYLHRAKEFGDVLADGVSVAKRAERELKALADRANLEIGKVAPDIEGEDVEGKTFKLSDYRGKVVVIDFWGDW